MELVSIVMSVYNEKPAWLRKSIESILNQTYQSIECIIILDNPENYELQIIIEEYQQKDQRIVFLKNDTNKGLVYSLNKGIKMANGIFIARMDADDYSIQERLEKQYNCLYNNEVDFVMSNVDFLYEEEFIQGSQVSALNHSQFTYMLQHGDVSIHPTWFFRKEIFDSINGYRDISYCEDLDFLFRAVQKGYKCYKMHEHLLQYRLRQNGITKSNGLEQFVKARVLRRTYIRKERVDMITPTYLLKCCEGINETDRQKFAEASKEIDQFVKVFNEKKMARAMIEFLRNVWKNKYYRILFFRAVNYRVRLMFCMRRTT